MGRPAARRVSDRVAESESVPEMERTPEPRALPSLLLLIF